MLIFARGARELHTAPRLGGDPYPYRDATAAAPIASQFIPIRSLVAGESYGQVLLAVAVQNNRLYVYVRAS